MYASRGKRGNERNSVNGIVKVTEVFYAYLYASNDRLENCANRSNLVGEVQKVTK